MEENPYSEHISTLFERLNNLNGSLSLLDNQLNNHRKQLQNIFKKNFKEKELLVFAFYSLPVSDLTSTHKGGYTPRYSSGGFAKQGEEYIKFSDEIIGKTASWTIAQAYESFETFIYNILATFLLNNNDYADRKKLKKFRETKDKRMDNFSDWREFLKACYRGKDNDRLLKLIRNCSPLIESSEVDNWRNLNLKHWYSVVSCFRHATTHSNFIINEKAFNNLTKNPENITLLEKFFPGKKVRNHYEIKLESKHSKEALKILADYGFLIFKGFSKINNHKWEIF